MDRILYVIDIIFTNIIRKISDPFARFSLFLVFFWFGLLKILGTSPATALVTELFTHTFLAQYISAGAFIIILGIVEMMIGIFFIIPHLERLVLLIMIGHMVFTFLPLILLPEITWAMPWTPTLEGQYIIKNVVLIAAALAIGSRIRPWHSA